MKNSGIKYFVYALAKIIYLDTDDTFKKLFVEKVSRYSILYLVIRYSILYLDTRYSILNLDTDTRYNILYLFTDTR